MSLKVYAYKGCGTCKKATQWLRQYGIPYEEVPIRETPPGPAELKRMLKAVDGDVRKLFNSSGSDYKAMNLRARVPSMSKENALKLLAENGNLVKRPFVIGPEVCLIGFNEALWNATLR
ncbi:MAG: Spx/MgsR family RNA polymerase-binding regulatory protein [Candidatus Hydrogenedentes bacterium]|nr:Spx/MgsR family RNA polymerase-binding regulatory protein [Candidatus Hydrogenedentota bacterium]